MTLAELMAETPAERWASLPLATRDAIGAAVVMMMLADLVVEDDGLDTTQAERESAAVLLDDASNALAPIFDAALPQWFWRYPVGTRYEARDRHGNVLGEVLNTDMDRYRFEPASPRMKGNDIWGGVPIDSLPAWVRRAVDRGGWFGAVLPDGRRYPLDFPRPSYPGEVAA